MRISPAEAASIKRVVAARDPDARVLLFGSRTDDAKRGGDIDLLILSSRLGEDDKLGLRTALYDELEEQRIDLVIARDASDPFVHLILPEARPL